MKEIWKDIPGYEGMYQVSNLGNVKSFKRNKEVLLKPAISKVGYYDVVLCKDMKQKTFRVHQLVAMAFLNHVRCGYKLVVDHINDIKTDNRVENLQIVTSRYNISKSIKNKSSKYIGVSWCNTYEKWVVQIEINKKKKRLGYFKNEYEAHLKYQETLKTI